MAIVYGERERCPNKNMEYVRRYQREVQTRIGQLSRGFIAVTMLETDPDGPGQKPWSVCQLSLGPGVGF